MMMPIFPTGMTKVQTLVPLMLDHVQCRPAFACSPRQPAVRGPSFPSRLDLSVAARPALDAEDIIGGAARPQFL